MALKVNEEYFKNIDTCKKAYWLGFILADGSLKTKNKLSLISKDREHIEKFAFDIESEYKISVYSFYDKRTSKFYDGAQIQISNSIFKGYVEKYIPITKSENFLIKNIDKEFYRDFIAGMIDGDGSIGMASEKGFKISLISTKECLEQIQNFLIDEVKLPISKTVICPVNLDLNVWKMYVYKGGYEFLKYIYHHEDKTMYLDRKQKRLEEYYKSYLLPVKVYSVYKTINVYDLNGNLINNLESVQDCMNLYNISHTNWYKKVKKGEAFNGMLFKYGKSIRKEYKK